MSEVVLEFSNLSKTYDGRCVLDQVSAQARAGQVIGIIGLNGAGKTTLLESALGFCLPDSGSSCVFGVPSPGLGASPVKSRIGFVPQQDELLGSLTGEGYLKLLSGFHRNWNQDLIARLTEDWQVPLSRSIDELSVGERQKLSIVSALGHEPELIVLDEPVASLDPVARRQFLSEVVALSADRAATILFSTHIVTDLERVAERIWCMQGGQLVIDDALDTLKERHPDSLEDIFLKVHA